MSVKPAARPLNPATPPSTVEARVTLTTAVDTGRVKVLLLSREGSSSRRTVPRHHHNHSRATAHRPQAMQARAVKVKARPRTVRRTRLLNPCPHSLDTDRAASYRLGAQKRADYPVYWASWEGGVTRILVARGRDIRPSSSSISSRVVTLPVRMEPHPQCLVENLGLVLRVVRRWG